MKIATDSDVTPAKTDNAKPEPIRRLNIEVYQDGTWQLQLRPASPPFTQFEAIGILSAVIGQLQSAQRIQTQMEQPSETR